MDDGIFSVAELRIMREAFDEMAERGETTRDHLARLVLIAARQHGAESPASLMAQVTLILHPDQGRPA